jgi:chorismate mutase
MHDGAGVRAVHGVAHVAANTPAAIEAAVHELLRRLPMAPGDVVISTFFASTADLDAAFPATAARQWGLQGAVLGLEAAGGLAGRIEMLGHVLERRDTAARS